MSAQPSVRSVPDARPRVLYVTGMTRCGSTMLGNVLNEVPGLLHIGELRFLWRNGLLEAGTNNTCGCGAELRSCPVWAAVLADPAVARTAAAADRIDAAQRRHLGHGRTSSRLAEAADGRSAPADLNTVVDAMVAVYRALQRQRGAPLIVDSSKFPAEAAALSGRSAEVDLWVLHMVRDPRATVSSYRRAKAYIDPEPAWWALLEWNRVNRASDRLAAALGDRYLRVRHEDFGRDPHGTIDRILRFLETVGPNPVQPGGRVELHDNHTVTGNPDRLHRGVVDIATDDGRRAALGRALASAVALGAATGLRRYGYPWRQSAPTASDYVRSS